MGPCAAHSLEQRRLEQVSDYTVLEGTSGPRLSCICAHQSVLSLKLSVQGCTHPASEAAPSACHLLRTEAVPTGGVAPPTCLLQEDTCVSLLF